MRLLQRYAANRLRAYSRPTARSLSAKRRYHPARIPLTSRTAATPFIAATSSNSLDDARGASNEAVLYLAVRSAPDFRASLGFGGGIGAILITIASIHNFSIAWLIPGIAFGAVALASFIAAEQLKRPGAS